VAARVGAGTPAQILLAGLAGALLPPIAPVVRVVLGEVFAEPAVREVAYAVVSILQELVWIAGPAVAALVVAVLSPSAAVPMLGLIVVLGTATFLRSSLLGGPSRAAGRRQRAVPARVRGSRAGRSDCDLIPRATRVPAPSRPRGGRRRLINSRNFQVLPPGSFTVVTTCPPMPKGRYPARMARLGLRVVSGGTYKERKADGTAAVRREEIVLNRRRIAYRAGGSGPLLVLIHGITSSSATWDRVVPRLARRYAVLAPDLLGHGRSDKLRGDYSVGAHANTVRDLLDALGHRSATFVGHSLGGGVALQLAYQYPERVDRLVLVAPGGFGREVTVLLRAASLPGSGPVLALVASRPVIEAGTLLAGALGRLGLRGSTDLEELGRACALLADAGSRRAFVHTLRSVVDHEGQRVNALDRIEVLEGVASLIVWGERDRILPARQGERIHRQVPHTRLSIFKEAGHFPHRDDPARFARTVDAFVGRRVAAQAQRGAAQAERAAARA
jgi:pimeloyl-ACP methyl ester carboxylesterase